MNDEQMTPGEIHLILQAPNQMGLELVIEKIEKELRKEIAYINKRLDAQEKYLVELIQKVDCNELMLGTCHKRLHKLEYPRRIEGEER
jgi:hypothetical protein